MTSPKVAISFLLALLLGLGLAVGTTSAAGAHGGAYGITFDQDGAGGITAIAMYTEDGHIVDSVMDLTVTARTADGRTAGPVALISSAEGQGVWQTPGPVLDTGVWTVTIATTTPLEVTVEKQINVVLATDPPVTPEALDEPAAAQPEEESFPVLLVVGAGAILLLVAVVIVLIVRRSRARRA